MCGWLTESLTYKEFLEVGNQKCCTGVKLAKTQNAFLLVIYSPLAQQVEQLAVNQRVGGSSPSVPAKISNYYISMES